MNKELRLNEILDKVTEQKTKEQVFEQLLKDFSRAQLTLNVDEKSTTEQWVEELIKVLEDLFKSDITKFYQLLYLIDVPQEYYLKNKELDSIDFGTFFAKLVLMRTLKKIAYRNQYS